MFWAQSADTALFRVINQGIANPFMDWCMPFFSGNRLFAPAVLIAAVLLIARGGSRARIFVPVLALVLALGDSLVINNVKHAVGRPRPYYTLEGTRELVGRGESGSMPSSHTSTWFAATLLAFAFYRRSWRFMLPLALLVALSRVYVGAHYPSDVLAGALLGAGYGAAGLIALNWLWRKVGPRWFPIQAQRWPSLLQGPVAEQTGSTAITSGKVVDANKRWMLLGYVLIGIMVVTKLWYIASGKIELSEDEAYQWLWSKHLALSYFSKPPFIAFAQFFGTSLFGDTELGVRFFPPVIAAILSVALLRFMAEQVNPRTAFWLIVVIQCTPLLAVGATLMTIDPLLVLFWTCAMIAGWRAMQPEGTLRDWIWTGIAMGAAFLSKYSAAYQVICFALFMAACRRDQFRKPGPYVALALALLCTIPVIVWNAQHHWITLRHVSENAGLNKQWRAPWRYIGDFLGSETFLLNPVFLVGSVIAAVAVWRRGSVLSRYFFWMSAPVLVGHLLYTFHSRVFANWIAPAIIPMLCLAVIYWEERARENFQAIKPWLITGLLVGAVPIVFLHDTNLIAKVTGYTLPAKIDPLRRVRAWRQTAEVVGRERQTLLAEGKDVFIIGAHYGLVGEISFYLPEARARVKTEPLVYYQSADRPENQFYFWTGYLERTGQNAIYVREEKESEPLSQRIQREFESVTDLGIRQIEYRGRVFRSVHLYACRNLRPDAKR
jgi:4-amino-4-deoxy-L-arabinose transferase-like glycosyltransferase/membrane-associated phospholipid phosphatase